MIKFKPWISQILGQLRVVVLKPMRFIHHQYLPFDSCQLCKVIRDQHLRRGNHNLYHPCLFPIATPSFCHLHQVSLIECYILHPIPGECKFVLSCTFTIVGTAVVDDGIQVRPSSKFSIPMGYGRQGSNHKERPAGSELISHGAHVGCCLNCFPSTLCVDSIGGAMRGLYSLKITLISNSNWFGTHPKPISSARTEPRLFK